MTRIEDHLTEAARQLRLDIDDSVDVDAALLRATSASRATASSRASRAPLLVAAAALLVVLAVAGFVRAGDRHDERAVVAGGPSTTADDASPTTAVGDNAVAFELLGEFPSSGLPGSVVYAGVADALTDQWAFAEVAEPAPTVDFVHQAVLVLTTAHLGGCPQELVSLDRHGTVVTPMFDSRLGSDECGAEMVARTYFVVVDRADVSPRFTLVLDGAPDGSYPEQRLEVDLDRNFASSAPPRETGGPPAPDGPDLQAPEPGREISFDGVGDKRLDQVLDPSAVTPYEGTGSCGYWGPGEPSHDGDEPLNGLFTGADPATPRVLSIMVWRNSTYRTASGVGIGTSLDTLERVYGEDLVVDRTDGWENPTDGLLASYRDVAAVRNGDRALTFSLVRDVVDTVKVSHSDFWGDDEGCA